MTVSPVANPGPDPERHSARQARAVEGAAQAKVNLRLRILAREAGGHHQLETLFLRLELADTVRVRRTASARTLDVQGVPEGSLGQVERNLAWRAAVAYAETGNWQGGFALELEKRVPVGGGLGGGSADAGTVLRALDAMAPAPLAPDRLLALAASLGADVPFMACTAPLALAWGRGERLLALEAPPQRAALVVSPPFGVNTAAAYGWLADARVAAATADGQEARAFTLAELASWTALDALAENDFEPVVAARHPEITASVSWLRGAGCTLAMMSGSGSTVFGLLPEGYDAGHPVADQLPRGSRLLATRTAERVEPIRPTE